MANDDGKKKDDVASTDTCGRCGMPEAMHPVLGFFVGPPTSAKSAPASGPAQVASPRYRHNYETIFGQRIPAGKA